MTRGALLLLVGLAVIVPNRAVHTQQDCCRLIASEVAQRGDATSDDAHLFSSCSNRAQSARDGDRDPVPVLGLGLELTSPRGGQTLVLGLPVVFRRAPRRP